ncbi:hypothetical protein ACMD2_17708 [Ananas comosus]|uniref:Uncharacterized protein n=1 Tax=Ananas comosus TaxID=4615 RepID=A0A199USB5_ANACO|nr:hypothetical protein ACMD2_17708 [Ananas comosus]
MLQRELDARPKVHSIENCMARLNDVPRLSLEAIISTCEALKDELNRSIFMSLSGDILYMWIERQRWVLYSIVVFFSSPTIADLMTFLDEEDEYWDEVLGIMINEGHQDRGYQHFHMSNTTFIRLRDELVEKGLIQARHQGNDMYFNMAMDPFSQDEQQEEPIPLVGIDDSRRGEALRVLVPLAQYLNPRTDNFALVLGTGTPFLVPVLNAIPAVPADLTLRSPFLRLVCPENT